MKSSEKIKILYNKKFKNLYIFGPILIILFGLILGDILKNNFQVTWFSFIVAFIYFLISFFVIKNNRKNEIEVSNILFNLLEFELFESFYSYALKKNKRHKNQYYLNIGISQFYKGEFLNAASSFSKINLNKLSLYQRKNFLINYYYYNSLNSVFLKEKERYNNFLKFLLEINDGKTKQVSELTRRLDAIFLIMNGKSSNYFENIESKTKLIDLENKYYRSKNNLIKNDQNSAKKLFIEIASETSQLYIVRDAKRILEMID